MTIITATAMMMMTARLRLLVTSESWVRDKKFLKLQAIASILNDG
jgi:hypothetical protein